MAQHPLQWGLGLACCGLGRQLSHLPLSQLLLLLLLLVFADLLDAQQVVPELLQLIAHVSTMRVIMHK